MATSASSRKTDKFRTPTKGCTGRTTRRCGPFCVPAQRRERQQPERETQAPDAPTHCRKTETAGRDSGLYSAESTRVLAAEYADGLRMAQRREAHGRHGHHAKRSTDWRAHDGHGHKTKLPAKETNPLQATLFYISCRQDTGRRPGAHSTPSSAGKCMPVMPMSLSEAYCMMRFREAMAAALSMS